MSVVTVAARTAIKDYRDAYEFEALAREDGDGYALQAGEEDRLRLVHQLNDSGLGWVVSRLAAERRAYQATLDDDSFATAARYAAAQAAVNDILARLT
jgi:hypothetical protein